MPKPDFQKFCSTSAEPSRYAIQKPFFREGFKWATDGRICIGIPAKEKDTEGTPDCLYLFEGFDAKACTEPFPAPQPDWTRKGVCKNCSGSRKVKGNCPTCGHYSENIPCSTCGGTGKEDKSKYVALGKNRYAAKYLKLIFEEIPNAKWCPKNKDYTAMFFAGDGGLRGALMPISKQAKDKEYED